MDALIASAGPLKPKKRNWSGQPRANGGGAVGGSSSSGSRSAHRTVNRGKDKDAIDPSTHSIMTATRVPSSFHQSTLASGSGQAPLRPDPSISRIADKKLRAKVARRDVASKRAQKERADVDEWLNAPLAGGQGGIEVDEEAGERTYRVRQEEIVESVGVASSSKRFDLKMEGMGSYTVDYTRNGRNLAIASSSGHVATFDWQAGRLHSETQLREPARDVKFLQSETFFAVAQKKYVYIYDTNGVELHKLKQHIDPTHLEYLPYHYLLTSVGHAGHLKYHDVSTGKMLIDIPTRLGSPHSMTQNRHSAIIHLGHANGTMTMWSPNMSTPYVKLLAHRGPVLSMAVDPSESSAGRYCATAGMDGVVKVWDGRMWGKELRSFTMRNSISTINYSGRGLFAVGGKSGVSVFRDVAAADNTAATTPYLTLPLPGLTAHSIAFCPFDDVLAIGHNKGVSSLLVPGSGEANFDSAEADVFESYSRRREREVRSVMEKIRPELITMDTEFLGKVREVKPDTYEAREARSYRQLGRMERLRNAGQVPEGDIAAGDVGAGESDAEDDDEDAAPGGKPEKQKKKMRGRGSATKRYLRKKKKNVIDSSLLAMRDKVAKQRQEVEQRRRVEAGQAVKESGALARFG